MNIYTFCLKEIEARGWKIMQKWSICKRFFTLHHFKFHYAISYKKIKNIFKILQISQVFQFVCFQFKVFKFGNYRSETITFYFVIYFHISRSLFHYYLVRMLTIFSFQAGLFQMFSKKYFAAFVSMVLPQVKLYHTISSKKSFYLQFCCNLGYIYHDWLCFIIIL